MDDSLSPQKSTWKTQTGFIWSVLGSAVGFANILSFSAQCYKNGGGAFLIPSLCAYVLLGIPMLVLEGAIGQETSAPFVTALGIVGGRIGKILGWLAIIACITIGSFYIVLTSYSLLFTYFSVADVIPKDTLLFFKNTFVGDSGSLSEWGSLSLPIFITSLGVSVVAAFVLVKNIQSGIEKVCSFAMPLLACLIIIFSVISFFLPGAEIGRFHYFTPDFARLRDPQLWLDVFGQLFFSLSLGLGIITGYSRYNGKKMNLAKAMSWVCAGDLLISFLSGLVIFSAIGFMSHETGTPFNQIIKSDSSFEIGFIIFPQFLKSIDGYMGSLVGGIFFICIFIAGITGVFSIIESIAGNFSEEFQFTRKKAVLIAIAIVSTLSCFFCMGNAHHIINALQPMIFGLTMLAVGFMEIIICLGIKATFRRQFIEYLSPLSSNIAIYLYGFILLLLGIVFIDSIKEEFFHFKATLDYTLKWIWLAIAVGLSFRFAKVSEKVNGLKRF